MKKFGFTIAELTVSFAVIGIIAALTLPNLMQNTQNRQIAPKLTKAASMFQQAAATMMSDLGIEIISDKYGLNDESDFMEKLSDYLKITESTEDTITGEGTNCFTTMPDFSTTYIAKDGVKYSLDFKDPTNPTEVPHKQQKGYLRIDINGSNPPNLYASDAFVFVLTEAGTLKPVGTKNTALGCNWNVYCRTNEEPTDPVACAGHIFENNFKVLYK